MASTLRVIVVMLDHVDPSSHPDRIQLEAVADALILCPNIAAVVMLCAVAKSIIIDCAVHAAER
jgi:hypothetical protein